MIKNRCIPLKRRWYRRDTLRKRIVLFLAMKFDPATGNPKSVLRTYLANRSELLLDTRTQQPKNFLFLAVIQYTVATCVGNSLARACRANHEGTFS